MRVPDAVSPDWTSCPTQDIDCWLYTTDNIEMGQFGFLSQHPGGANFLFGDGSVRFIKSSIDIGNLHTNPAPADSRIGVYRALSTRAKGEAISADQF